MPSSVANRLARASHRTPPRRRPSTASPEASAKAELRITKSGVRASPARRSDPRTRHARPDAFAPSTNRLAAPCPLLVNACVDRRPPIPGALGSGRSRRRITPPIAPAPYSTPAAPLTTSISPGANGSISGACSPPHCWPSCCTPLSRISTRSEWSPRTTGLATVGPEDSVLTPLICARVSPSDAPRRASSSSPESVETARVSSVRRWRAASAVTATVSRSSVAFAKRTSMDASPSRKSTIRTTGAKPTEVMRTVTVSAGSPRRTKCPPRSVAAPIP